MQTAIDLVGACWLAFEVWRTAREMTRRGQHADRNSRFVIVISFLAGAIGTVWLARNSVWAVLDINFDRWIGFVLIVLGLALRIWAVVVLGKFFTGTVMIQADHHVVNRGPYRSVRHPSYTAIAMGLIGYAISTGSFAAVCTMALAAFIGLGYRIRIEEEALLEALGTEYLEYSERTKRLVPGLY